MKGGGNPTPERIGLARYLGRWLEYQRTRGVRSRTLKAYEGYIRREITPVIGGLEIADIRPGHIRTVLTRMQQRGLAAATVAQVRGILGSALRQAVEDGLISANPVTAVKRPKVRRADLHWPTAAELGAVLRTSQGTIWEIPILLAAVTGARRSEILGISWQDVDLTLGTIFIHRGVHPLRDAEGTEHVAFTPLKTKRARRFVQLPTFALERIRRHRREQLGIRTALGPRWRDPVDELGAPVPLVCERGDGFPLYPDSFTSAFKRLARQAGLHPGTRLHDVRHAVRHRARPPRCASSDRLGRPGSRLARVHSRRLSACMGRGPRRSGRSAGGGARSILCGVGNPLAAWAAEPSGDDPLLANEQVRRALARRWRAHP